MKKEIVAVSAFLLLSLSVFAQSPVTLNSEGDKYFQNGQYAQAAQFYQQALNTEPNNQLANYQLAECFRLTLKYQEAELLYEKMVNLSETNYPMSRYYFALMQKLNGKYDEAMPNFQKFISRYDQDPVKMERFRNFKLQALVEREGCLLALNELSNPVRDNQFMVLPAPLNSEFDDYAPYLFKGDSSVIITSSRRSSTGASFDARMGQATADLFRMQLVNGTWQEVTTNDRFSGLNTKDGEGTGIFNSDFTKVYFTYNPPEGSATPSQIYKSDLVQGRWSEPRALNININARNTESRHPSLSPGNDTLFFVSNRTGGQGGNDIWFSIDAGNDNWGPAQNLGSSINTSLDEVAPFYDHLEKVLFFSSNGHRGFGGYDIFMTSGYDFENSEIYNMGYPYNSNRDDLFFVLGKKKGYLTSGRDGGVGGLDIYSFSIVTDEEIIAEILGDDVVAGRTSVFSDDYDFETNNIEKIEEIISHFLAARMFNTEVMLTSDELAFYDSLSDSDKEKVERIINSRVRKLTEKDLRAVRTEDEFYYQQLSSGDKYSINRMVSSYLEEDGLGLSVSLSAEEKTYYEKLSKDAKEKVDQYITLKVTEYRSKEINDEYYESLPEADKTQVKNIARSYLIQKKALPNLALGVASNMFLNKQRELDMNRAENTIVAQLKNLATETEYNLNEDDRIFYQNLPSQDKEAIDRLVTAFLASNPSDFEQNVSASDLEFYNRRPTPQKLLIDKIIVKRLRNLSFSDEYVFNHSSAKQTALLASLNTKTQGHVIVNQVGNLLTGYNKDVYSTLDEKEKLRFARMVAEANTFNTLETEQQPDTEADQKTELIASKPNKPAEAAGASNSASTPVNSPSKPSDKTTDTKQAANTDAAPVTENAIVPVSRDKGEVIIDQTASETNVAKVPTNRAAEVMAPNAVEMYEVMSQSKKRAIDRIVAVNLVNKEYTDSPQAAKDDEKQFEQYSAEDKRVAKRLAKYLVEDNLSTAELQIVKNDLIYYKNFTPAARKTFNHYIIREAYPSSAGVGKIEVASTDKVIRSELKPEERSMLESLISLRSKSNFIFGDNLPLENKYAESSMIIASVDQFQTAAFNNLKIQGKLVEIASGKPKMNFPVVLANAAGESIKIAHTNSNGEFVFDYLDGNKAYKILSSKSPGASYAPDSFFIKDLQVRGYREGYAVMDYESIYFDSDASDIRTEGTVSLKKLVEIYKKYPEIEIEIHAHSDNQGEKDYNHKLSNKRGDAIYEYLVRNGVDETALTVYAKGEGDPVANNLTTYGRAFNRRVELEVYSSKPLPVEVAKFFVVRPNVTYKQISGEFKVSETQLLAMNGATSGDIKPYTPIRIEGKPDVKPSLNLLVELNDHSVNFKQYKVKQGESIISIAEKFNLPEELLIELNGLNGVNLTPGTIIDIYVSY